MPRKPKDPKAAERQARRREKQRTSGLQRFDVWARPEHWDAIKAFVAKLTRSSPANTQS